MCDGEPATIFTRRPVKTRKPHRCEDCLSPIPVGTTVIKVDMLVDYGWLTYYACDQCEAIRDVVSEWDDGFRCYGRDALRDELENQSTADLWPEAIAFLDRLEQMVADVRERDRG